MSRRKESTKDRLRAEENELDKQLRDAGLYEEGLEVEMKRIMLQMLEESRKSAEQEEQQRQHWKQKENQILTETLSRSSKSNPEERHDGEVGSSKENRNEDSSCDSDVVAVLVGEGDPGCISDSGPSTPDLSHHCSRSPELMIPSISPSIPCSLDTSAPVASGSHTVRKKTGGSLVKPHSSEEDIICDLESSEASKTQNRASKCFQQIGEITNSDAQIKETRNSGLVDAIKKGVEKHESSSITSSVGIQDNSVNKHHIVESRKPLKHSSIEIVPTPSSKSEECSKKQIQHHSQPLFSSNESSKSLDGQIEEDGVQLISPFVGHKRSLGSSVSDILKDKVASLQDAEVSNSLEVQVVQQTSVQGDDEDESFLFPTTSASQGSNSSRLEDHEVPSPLPNDSLADEPQKILQNHKISLKGLIRDGMLKRPQVDICSTVNSTSKLKEQEEEKENICSFMALSEHESISCNYKKDRKRNVNVFFIEETADVPLKRRRIEKIEEPSKAFFRKIEECPKDCVLRIMNMIDHMMKRIEKHQAENIYHKMKWSVPLTIDKRLKDSLDRPKVQNRRYIRELETGFESEHPRRTARLPNKGTGSFDIESYASDDSFPDLYQNHGDWIDVHEKRRGKKRGLNLGVSCKQPKLIALLEGKEEMVDRNQGGERAVVYESDDDTDDFEIFPLNSSQPKLSLCAQMETEGCCTPKKDSRMECSEVSSSKACESAGDRNSEKASDTENIQVDSQISEEENLIELDKKETSDESDLNRKEITNEKRQMTGSPELSKIITKSKQCTSAESRAPKQHPRKSFMLRPNNSIGQGKAFDVGSCSTSPTQELATLKLQDSVLEKKRPAEQLKQQNTILLRKLEGSVSGKHMQAAVKRDNSGRKINSPTYVSSSRKEPFESIAGPSSNADICIVEDDSPLRGVSGVDSPRRMDKNPRRVISGQDPIRPAPLRFKINHMGNKREAEISGNQLKPEIGNEQITSSDRISVQEFGDDSQVDNSAKENDKKEMMRCPLCQKFFPVEKIEVHASDCSEQAESPQKRTCQLNDVTRKGRRKHAQRELEVEDVKDKQLPGSIRTSGVIASNEIRTPATYERCVICKMMFKEGDEYTTHVQSCESMKEIQDSITTPPGTRTPGNKREAHQGVGCTPNRGMRGTRPNVRTGSLFDHLEESKEEYEIPTSPIKNFIPISKQTNSLIDYHHQFCDKTQKSIMIGAKGAHGVRRGHKRRRTRKKEENKSKKKK